MKKLRPLRLPAWKHKDDPPKAKSKNWLNIRHKTEVEWSPKLGEYPKYHYKLIFRRMDGVKVVMDAAAFDNASATHNAESLADIFGYKLIKVKQGQELPDSVKFPTDKRGFNANPKVDAAPRANRKKV